MKTTKMLLTIVIMTLTSFTTKNALVSERIATSDQLGMLIISALQHESEDEYAELFPSLEDFYKLMNTNREVYGSNLDEAKKSFASEYKEILIPSVRKSFRQLVKAGNEKGIVWSKVTFRGTDFNWRNQSMTSLPGTISFAYKGQLYQVRLEKAVVLDNNWRVGQYLKLM